MASTRPSTKQDVAHLPPKKEPNNLTTRDQGGTVDVEWMYSNVGRNDSCPCGSGKKFKRCHGSPVSLTPSSWATVASSVKFEHPQGPTVHWTFFALVDYLQKTPIAGGCHLLSAAFHVLLAEQGVNSTLRIGEVLRPDGKGFDHSWVEINGEVFDVAIQLTLDAGRNAPVYAGVSLGNGAPTMLKYGIHSTQGLDSLAETVLHLPFVEYMDGWPGHPQGAWGLIVQVAKTLGLVVDVPSMRKRYAGTRRVY